MIKLIDLYKELYNKENIEGFLKPILEKQDADRILLGVILEEMKKVELGLQATFLLKIVVDEYKKLEKSSDEELEKFIDSIETLFESILNAEVDKELFKKNENTTDNKDGK